jgi:hypothetical protein
MTRFDPLWLTVTHYIIVVALYLTVRNLKHLGRVKKAVVAGITDVLIFFPYNVTMDEHIRHPWLKGGCIAAGLLCLGYVLVVGKSEVIARLPWKVD